ncbi:nuclear transport factor 2 family protein [Fulvivirgaceae bacterium BMA10]|uniref:Nuclear transport factor 2 family protein n=1 Tax=Splendidivirga corallicola TaxID=3051826 RepID=A0ABT8KS40_9BACT|nr:nuclear transport factor 2 family protein [Fulvivirgaceae bacterium BMA10]
MKRFKSGFSNPPWHSIVWCYLLFTIGCDTPMSQTITKPKTMESSYIFQKEIQNKYLESLTGIYDVMGNYYQGVEKAELHLLKEVFHNEWLMKDTDNPGATTLNVEGKAAFLKRVADHGPYQDYAKERVIADIGFAYDDLCFVRVNKDPSRNSTSFFLFKIGDSWKIMDKIWVNPRKQHREPSQLKSSFAEVETLINNYYEALSRNDVNLLSVLIHEDWDLKYQDASGILQVVNKHDFLQTFRSDTHHQFMDFSQLPSIEIYHDQLAIARIDQPDKYETTYLVIFKVNGQWYVTNERRSSKDI